MARIFLSHLRILYTIYVEPTTYRRYRNKILSDLEGGKKMIDPSKVFTHIIRLPFSSEKCHSKCVVFLFLFVFFCVCVLLRISSGFLENSKLSIVSLPFSLVVVMQLFPVGLLCCRHSHSQMSWSVKGFVSLPKT